MKKTLIIAFCLFLVGCQSNEKTVEEVADWFGEKDYLFSFGPNGIVISDEENMSFMAIIDEEEVEEMSYMDMDSGEGIIINKDGDYEALPETENGEEYYEKYEEILDEIGTTEEGLFAYCVWRYREYDDYMKESPVERADTWFEENNYVFSIGRKSMVIRDEYDNSFMITFEDDRETVKDICYMLNVTGEGVRVTRDGNYEWLSDTVTTESYDEYKKVLVKAGITEEEFFDYCEWRYKEWYDATKG